MNYQSVVSAFTILTVFSCVQVWGHRPIEAEEQPDRYDRALNIDRPDVSQVYYGTLEVERPQVWFRFEGKENQEIYFSVGVPVIDRLKYYRPHIALIGPGLPGPGIEAGELPFQVPSNLEGEIYYSHKEPRFFHEHFTDTESWIHIEVTRRLPRSGTYYLVAFTPNDPKPGDKLWLAMGTKERFKLRDFFVFRRWKREIQTFHETR
ncbi:MAG: hypothetical protein JSV89_11030 [Spirochaetaceae bacterium]|nr:MAG: hypothetical protein JSV89_11030 [Spirochaetaceae bacterium]